MLNLTRRAWHKLLFGIVTALSVNSSRGVSHAAERSDSPFNRVRIGVQSYSFRNVSLDGAVEAMASLGIKSCELWSGHVEPRKLHDKLKRERDPQTREELRRWRLIVPLDEYRRVRAKFERAGVALHGFSYDMRDDFTDEEIGRGFEMADALGVKLLTSSSNVTTAKRIDSFAAKHRVYVGMHNHSNTQDQNEFATPESFNRALDGASKYLGITLNIGNLTAAGFDVIDFMRRHHTRILSLHINDRKRNQGAQMPFGQGDTPVKAALMMLRRKRWSIPATVKYQYAGGDARTEVERCVAYCRQALIS